MTDIVCIGQALVDCISRGFEEKEHKKNVYKAESICLNVGGDAVNEAVRLRGLGRDVRVVCGLGDDEAGNLVLDVIKRNGIDSSYVTVSHDIATPVAMLLVRADGGRSSVNSPATMLGDYVPDAGAVRGAKIVSLASLFRAPLDRDSTVRDLAKAAKAEGAILCADTKLPTYREMPLSDIEDVLPLIDYIFPNRNEALYHTGTCDIKEAARALRAMGVKNVIVKDGENGCFACSGEEEFSMPAEKVEAVDSTGAGDTFVAGFMSALLDGDGLFECCRKATHLAAESVKHAGSTIQKEN